jgi:hypothetical protein
VALIKDNPVIQGRNLEKQSKHFVPKIHMLAALKFLVSQQSTKRVSLYNKEVTEKDTVNKPTINEEGFLVQ